MKSIKARLARNKSIRLLLIVLAAALPLILTATAVGAPPAYKNLPKHAFKRSAVRLVYAEQYKKTNPNYPTGPKTVTSTTERPTTTTESLPPLPTPDPSTVLDVRSFGAKGDGVSDDTSPIQSALNSAAKGQAVYLPAGTYRTGKLNIAGKSGVTLYGDGPASVLQSSAADTVLNVYGSSGLLLRDFKVLGDYAQTEQRGITFRSVYDLQVSRVETEDVGFSGFFANGVLEDAVFSGIRAVHSGDFGIQVKTGAKRVRIEDGYFSEFASRLYPAHGIYAEGAEDITIVGNYVSRVDDAPGRYEVSGIKVTQGSGALVENNLIEDSFAAVSLPGADNVLVRNNTGKRLEKRGIYILAGSTACTLQNNLVEDAPAGFVFDHYPSWPDGITLTDNRLVDVPVPVIEGSATGLVISGNSWQAGGETPITVPAPTTTLPAPTTTVPAPTTTTTQPAPTTSTTLPAPTTSTTLPAPLPLPLPEPLPTTPPSYSDILNVKAFGARGDGTSDDTAAIQSALNSATSGEAVYLPAGIYRVGKLSISGKSGIALYGDGPTSQLKSSAVDTVINVYNSRSLTLRDFKIQGDYGQIEQRGVTFNQVYTLTVARVHTQDVGFSAFFSNGPLEDAVFTGLRIVRSGDFGIQVKTGAKRIRIENSYMSDFVSRLYPAHGVYASEAEGVTVTGNYISQVHDAPNMYEVSGIKMALSSGLVENNLIEDSHAAVSLPGSYDTIVRNNTGRRLEKRGFYILAGARNNRLENNVVDTAPAGFVFDHYPSWPSNTTLSGNRLINVGTPVVSGSTTGLYQSSNSWQ